MTDSLIVLKNEAGDEGFFKFEDGYRNMTAAFSCKKRGKFIWVLTDADGEFKKNHIYIPSPVKQKPLDCGIFLVLGQDAYPILHAGSRQALCARITDRYSIKDIAEYVESAIISAESAEIAEEDGIKTSVSLESVQSVNVAETQSDKLQVGDVTAQIEPDTLNEPPQCFWDCNKTDYEKLFADNPALEYMNALIPDSKWVQLTDYVFGVIYDENSEPMYLCYGFDYPWSEDAPEKLDGYSQWIPKDISAPHDKGMWVIYINAKTGERVR